MPLPPPPQAAAAAGSVPGAASSRAIIAAASRRPSTSGPPPPAAVPSWRGIVDFNKTAPSGLRPPPELVRRRAPSSSFQLASFLPATAGAEAAAPAAAVWDGNQSAWPAAGGDQVGTNGGESAPTDASVLRFPPEIVHRRLVRSSSLQQLRPEVVATTVGLWSRSDVVFTQPALRSGESALAKAGGRQAAAVRSRDPQTGPQSPRQAGGPSGIGTAASQQFQRRASEGMQRIHGLWT